MLSSFLRMEYQHALFGILLPERFVSSPHLFIYSIIYLISTDSWMLPLNLGYNQKLLHFVAQIILALAVDSSFSCLC